MLLLLILSVASIPSVRPCSSITHPECANGDRDYDPYVKSCVYSCLLLSILFQPTVFERPSLLQTSMSTTSSTHFSFSDQSLFCSVVLFPNKTLQNPQNPRQCTKPSQHRHVTWPRINKSISTFTTINATNPPPTRFYSHRRQSILL